MKGPADPDRDAVNETYAFVVPSAEWAMQRMSAVDSRLQQILTVTGTLTVLAPAAGAGLGRSFEDPLGLIAILLGVGIIASGLKVMTMGGFQVLTVDAMHRRHMHKNPRKFRRDVIAAAAKIQRANHAEIRRRGKASAQLGTALAVQALLVVLWLTGFWGFLWGFLWGCLVAR